MFECIYGILSKKETCTYFALSSTRYWKSIFSTISNNRFAWQPV